MNTLHEYPDQIPYKHLTHASEACMYLETTMLGMRWGEKQNGKTPETIIKPDLSRLQPALFPSRVRNEFKYQ